MALEIERKFLVKIDHPLFEQALANARSPKVLLQGYVSSSEDATVRVRIVDGRGVLTIKGRHDGLACPEYEWPIDVVDATEILNSMCSHRLKKERRVLPLSGGLVAEIDFFPDLDLWMVEVELPHRNTPLDIPVWFGQEVTGQPEWSNAAIAQRLSTRT